MSNDIKKMKYNSEVGFEFEFIRKPELNIGEIKQELQKLFKVKINIEDAHHSDFIPTEFHWKMEPDFSGGKYLVELVTAPIPYSNARIVLMKMLKWINKNPNIYASDRCGLHININLPDPYITRIDLLKFILDFDESYVYKLFPERSKNIYAKTIKAIYPAHVSFNIDDAILNSSNYIYPSNKYYGINFTKLAHDYLEFRYLGGEHYAKKVDECMDMMDFFIMSLINSQHNPYSSEHLIQLKEILNQKHELFIGMKSYFAFTNIFKNIQLLADGSDNNESIKSHFHKIIQVLFPLFQKMEVINYKMSGIINYDSDDSTIEFKDFKFKDTIIEGTHIIIYDSVIESCVVENTTIKYSTIEKTDLTAVDTEGCTLNKARLKDGFHTQDEIMDSYINGKTIELESCEIGKNTIFREGSYKSCNIDDSVEMIDAEEIEK